MLKRFFAAAVLAVVAILLPGASQADAPTTIPALAERWAELRREAFRLHRESAALAEAHGIKWYPTVIGSPYRDDSKPQTFNSPSAICRAGAFALHVCALSATSDDKAPVWGIAELTRAAAQIRASCDHVEAWVRDMVGALDAATKEMQQRAAEAGIDDLNQRALALDNEADAIVARLAGVEPTTPAEACLLAMVVTIDRLLLDPPEAHDLATYEALWRAGDAHGVDLRHLPAEALATAEAGQSVDQPAAA